MPGPGGGPSRRSHNKSRKGCKTCKRRHIRCDETKPECRNCIKHQVRCDYMDREDPNAVGGDKSGQPSHQPNLLWTPEIERAVDTWRRTGEFPFPDLQVFPQPQWSLFSRVDLRLLYHVASICSEVNKKRLSEMTLWTSLMPKFLSAAASDLFVTHSILSFAANHLAWITKSAETRNLAMQRRQMALTGLHEAIGNFSQANSDAVLASSLLLSWQATDWRNWASLMTGIGTVVRTMQSWRHESIFVDYLKEHALDPVRNFSDSVGLAASQDRRHEHLVVLQNVSGSLTYLQPFPSSCEVEKQSIEQLKGYVDRLKSTAPPQSPEEQFGQLYALRKLLFWVPVSLLSSRSPGVFTFLALAHFYAVAIALEPIFPDIGADFCANLALSRLKEISRTINQVQSSQSYSQRTQQAAAMMEFPSETASSYLARKDWTRQSSMAAALQQPQAYALDSLDFDLGGQMDAHGFYQSMSPAFGPSSLHAGSPHLSSGSILSAQSGGSLQSPFIEVPNTPPYSLESTHGYLGGTSAFSPPLRTPQASPAFAATSFGGWTSSAEEQTYGLGVTDHGWVGGFVPSVWTC